MKIERAIVINLKRRPDRLQEIREKWDSRGTEGIPLEVQEAFDGFSPEVWDQKPNWLACGRGGWGCYLSQRACLQSAVDTGKNTLILEDDAFLVPEFREISEAALAEVPEDAGFVYLGGQHFKIKEQRPIKAVEGKNFNWWKPYNVNRMHGYLVTPEAAKWVLETLDEEIARDPEEEPRFKSNWQKDRPNNHIDHRMGWIHESAFADPHMVPFAFYALDPWIIHQGEGSSNINGTRTLPHRAWHTINEYRLGPTPIKASDRRKTGNSIQRQTRVDRIRERRAESYRRNFGRPSPARKSRFGRKP